MAEMAIKYEITHGKEDDYYHMDGENFALTYITYKFAPDWVEDVIYVERIDVDEGHRGKGIGTAVLQLLAKKYRAVFVAPDGEDSKRLYARIGVDAYTDSNPRYFDDTYIFTFDTGFGLYEILNPLNKTF